MPTEPSLIPARWLPSAKSILLLEEKSAAERSHVAILLERGYRVVLTHCGAAAYQSWNECRPDLVLLSFRRFDQGLFDFLASIQVATPRQRIAFLHDGNLLLAPGFYGDDSVRVAEPAQDYLRKIDALLA